MYKKYLQELPYKEEKDEYKKIVTSCWKEVENQCKECKPSAIKTSPKSSGWKVVRVFVSSTFTDFFNEREVLVKKVFPELREWCSTRHIHLIECDLRWGVPKEATTQDVISICLEELDRCHLETDEQPFFIGLIGKRYGWIPGDQDISEDLKQKLQWVDNTSITFMEILHGAYRCKSVNAAFFLRSDEVVKSLPDHSVKRFVDEEPLNQHHLTVMKKKLRSRFPDQVFEYDCMVEGMVEDAGKERVKLTGLDKFSEQTTEFFKTAITRMYGNENLGEFDEEYMEKENQRLYVENKSDLVVGQDKLQMTLKSYIHGEPLKDVLVSEKSTSANIRANWDEPAEEDNMIMCVKGHPGFGKSTLLAKTVADLIKEGHDVFYHFVGCSASSRNTEFMYQRLLKTLEDKIQDTDNADCGEEDDRGSGGGEQSKQKESEDTEVSKKNKMMLKMKELLPKMREQHMKLIIIIDAVNELADSDTYNHLSWLPPCFPGNIKCIISSADNHLPTIARLTEHPCYVCEVGPITKEAAESLVIQSLKKFNKQLDSGQLSMIVSSPCATNPLWLKILLEELRVFGDFRMLDTKIDQISDSVESLLTKIITRLVNEDDTGLVNKALFLLVRSLGGIKTEDLQNMLGDVNNREPVAPLYWSQIRRDLKPYIKEIGIPENISFYHSEIYKNVSQLFEGKQTLTTEWVKLLGLYYTQWCPDERLRAQYGPAYCLNAKLKSELINFFNNDVASRHVPGWKRSRYFKELRCRTMAFHPQKPQSAPVVVICQSCSFKNRGPVFPTRNEDCCVVCKGRLDFSKKPANLCHFHAFGHTEKYGKCLYCNMHVPKDNENVQKHRGTTGQLCMHCGFGNDAKMCSAVSTK